jgi:hypothetical protein
MLVPRPKERIKMSFIMATIGSGGKAVGGGRRRSLDGGGYSGQAAASVGMNGNTTLIDLGANGISTVTEHPRKPELSVFDGYFQSQSRRIEPAGGW